MKYAQDKFDQAIWNVVKNIKPGSIMGYGEVARVAGFPRYARMVSKAMGRSPEALPWHRVVKSDRTLAFAPGTDIFNKQKALLEKEGVQFLNGKAVPREKDEVLDLDRLMWGPEDN